MIETILATLLGRKRSQPDSAGSGEATTSFASRQRWGTVFGDRFVRMPVVRNRVPARVRPTLYFETLYNVGAGAFVAFMLLSPVVLKTVIGGTGAHLALLQAMLGGSSLLSPLVSYLGRRLPMRTLVVAPNYLVCGLLIATALPLGGPLAFTLIIGMAFIVRVFPRVAEMNMYRVNYPPTCRGAAVGWVKAIAAISGLFITLLGYWWISFLPDSYYAVYCLVGAVLFGSAFCYSRIPISRRSIFTADSKELPHHAFVNGLKVFLADRRFVLYQFGFALAGFANHMAIVFIAQVLADDVLGQNALAAVMPAPIVALLTETWGLEKQTVVTLIVGLVCAALPMLLMMTSSLFWGRFLDRTNPMYGRAIFNTFQCVAYACHAYGGLTLQVWPFVVGASLHAIGNGGGTINWLTGSLYFARHENVSLYNAIHVGLTGVRGMIAPAIGFYLYSASGMGLGSGIFWIASTLSLLGGIVVLVQGMTDPGPREPAPET